MGHFIPRDGNYPNPASEYIYTPPPGIRLRELFFKWKTSDPNAYQSIQIIASRCKRERWVDRRRHHWEEVVLREAQIQAAIDIEAVTRSRNLNALTVAAVQEGLRVSADMALRRLNARSNAGIDTPKADRADTEILVKAAVGSEVVAKIWAGFHGVTPGFEQDDILIEYVTPDWAIPDEFEPDPEQKALPPGTKIIDLVPKKSNGSNGET